MKSILFALFSLLLCIEMQAQNTEVIRVPAGSNPVEVLSKQIYLYPGFVKGKVFFKDGAAPEPKLNYNLLTGEMQYIDLKNDTLSIANALEINLLTIGNDSFYYDQGYLKSITGNPLVILASLQKIKFLDNQPIGAYGQPSSSTTIKPYQTYAHTGQIHKLAMNEEILLSKETIYYFGNRNKQFRVASKKNVLQLYPKRQHAIEKYLRENNVAFHRKEDLMKLAAFLQSL